MCVCERERERARERERVSQPEEMEQISLAAPDVFPAALLMITAALLRRWRERGTREREIARARLEVICLFFFFDYN